MSVMGKKIKFSQLIFLLICRDEVLSRNVFFEEEARRKAEAVDNGDESFSEITPAVNYKDKDSSQNDDIFYDFKADQSE